MSVPQPNQIPIEKDKILDYLVDNTDRLVNKLLRIFLHGKFEEFYGITDHYNSNEYSEEEIQAIKNYKVDTRLLGGILDDYGEPKIVSKGTNLSKKMTNTFGFFKATSNNELTYLMNGIKKWGAQLENIELPERYNIIDSVVLREKLKIKFNNLIIGSTIKGGKTRRKRSRKNITRRKK